MTTRRMNLGLMMAMLLAAGIAAQEADNATSAMPTATTFVIYPGGASDYLFHQPTGTGTAHRDVHVTVNAAKGTIRVQSAAEDTFRLIVNTPRPPAGVRGADDWSHDAERGFLRIEKRGRDWEVRIDGLIPSSSAKAKSNNGSAWPLTETITSSR